MREPLRSLFNEMRRCRALRANFYVEGGKLAEVGQEFVTDLAGAVMLQKAGKAEIIGNAPPKLIALPSERHEAPAFGRVE